ncbi:Formamidase [subsurface metagenome]
MKTKILKIFIVLILISCFTGSLHGQNRGVAKVAVIQAVSMPHQDPFMGDYDPSMVYPQSQAHFDKLLGLFDQAGGMGADLVCGPEDMQHIASYGLHVDVTDPSTGEMLFKSLVEPVPGPLTDRIAEIAHLHRMYIIAPLFEREGDRVFNTAVIFDRDGRIMGKYRKTVLPVMETWGVDTGDEFKVFETDFATIAVATCWEITFPEIPTILALKGADIIFNPTMGGTGPEGLSTAHCYITRAMENSVYIAPVTLGTNGTGIIDFNGNVLAEAVGAVDTVIMAEIDFSKERINESRWWAIINGTANRKALHFLSRRPETYKFLLEPNPPILQRYKDIHLTTGDREKQLKAVRKVDYGPKENKTP